MLLPKENHYKSFTDMNAYRSRKIFQRMSDCYQLYLKEAKLMPQHHMHLFNREEQEEMLPAIYTTINNMSEERRKEFFIKVITYAWVFIYSGSDNRERKEACESTERLRFRLYVEPLLHAEMKEHPLYERNVTNIIGEYTIEVEKYESEDNAGY